MKKSFLSMVLAVSLVLSLMVCPVSAGTESTSSDEVPAELQETVYFSDDFDADSTYSELSNVTQITKITNAEGKDVLRMENTSGKKDSNGALVEVGTVNTADLPEKFVMEYKVYVSSSDASACFGTREKADKSEIESAVIYLNEVKSTNTAAAPVLMNKGGFNEWKTLSAVIDTKNKTRNVYLNGESEATSLNVPNVTDYANIKTAVMKFAPFMRTAGNYAEVDYLKLYVPAETFKAEVSESENEEKNELIVRFNSIPDASTINAENICVTDGVKSIKATEATLIDEKTYAVTLEAALGEGKEYSASLGEVKDLMGTVLSETSVQFTSSGDLYNEPSEYYYNTLDVKTDFSYDEGQGEVAHELTTRDDLSVLRFYRINSYENAGDPQFRFPEVKPAAENAPAELVLEYKVKMNVGQNSYLDCFANTSYNRPETVGLGVLGFEDKVVFKYNMPGIKPIKEGHTADISEWNTVTIVYPKNANSRDVYFNGEYLGTSAESNIANTYASLGAIRYTPFPCIKNNGDEILFDYVKVTDKTVSFDAKVSEASGNGIVVKFNTTPGNIKAESFTLSGDVAISAIRQINETTYMLIPERQLPEGKYTLTLNNIKDTLGRELSQKVKNFKVEGASSENTGVKTYYYNDFDSQDDIGTLTAGEISYPEIGISSDSEKASVLKLKTDSPTVVDSNALDYYELFGSDGNGVVIEGKPKLVMEMRVRFGGTNSYSYLTTSSKNLAAFAIGGSGHRNNVRANYRTTEALGEVTRTEWNTYTVVYDNEKISRDIYVNGKFLGTADSDHEQSATYSANSYAKTGAFSIILQTCLRTNAEYIEIDYVNLYSLPEGLKLENVSASEDLSTVYLDFDAQVGEITADMIKINGSSPASIEAYNGKEFVYALKTVNKLKAGENVSVIINGVKSAYGDSTCVEAVDFTARAPKNFNVTVSADDASKGKVKINGAEAASLSVAEDSTAVITVKPELGYAASVSVDGNALTCDRLDNYTIKNIGSDVNVEISYSAVTEVPKNLESLQSVYVDEKGVYAFAMLNMAADEYGFIASPNAKNLNMEAVKAGNAIKIKANKINRHGEYGVMILDRVSKLGDKYYLIAYAVYGDTVVLGAYSTVAEK